MREHTGSGMEKRRGKTYGSPGTGLIDRRRFVLNAGLFAAGSAFGCSFVSCSKFELSIPCLGPALAPLPVPGMRYIRASEIGCALDCDLGSGRNKHTGGHATDDGPRINAAMAGATAMNPITLIIDGSALISGLFLPEGGNWSIAGLGCGTGFYIKSGTNNDGIHNGSPDAALPFNPGPPAPPRGGNVTLSNFTLNGNQGDGSNGNSTTGMRQGTPETWYCGINLMNLNNIKIENVVVVNTPAFHFRLSNVGNVQVSGCVMKSFGLSTDGLHFDGPANDITISNCQFMTGDDSIALNCPEGYTGDISRVAVTDCTFNSLSLMRIYTTTGDPSKPLRYYVDGVSVKNCSGTLTEAAFLIGLAMGSNPNSISLAVSDCNLTSLAILAIAENFGTISLTNVTFTPAQTNVIWLPPPQATKACAFVRPSPLEGYVPSVGSSLSFNNCTIYRNSDREVGGLILENGSTIKNLEFNGFAVQDASSHSTMHELINIGSGSIAQLVIGAVNATNIASPISPGGFSSIQSVAGAGVLSTGWEFPDAVMANDVPYISASTGLPSIKTGGVVEAYPKP